MVGERKNEEDAKFDLGTVQSLDEVKEAVDSMIDATIGLMAETGGGAAGADRPQLLQDLVNMFDERVQAAEGELAGEGEAAEGAGVRLGTLRAARDRAAERYKRETGRSWERATG